MKLRFLFVSLLLISIIACGKSKPVDQNINSSDLAVEPKDATIDQLSSMITNNPNDPECYYYRGLRYMDAEDYTMAIQDLDACIKLDSTNAVAWFNRGTSHFSLNNFDKALNDYNRAIQIEPMYTDAY